MLNPCLTGLQDFQDKHVNPVNPVILSKTTFRSQKFNLSANWIWRLVPRPTVRSTVCRKSPNAPPACDWLKPPPGCKPPGASTPTLPAPSVTLGSALFRVVDGTAKFVLLKMLNISVRNSIFVDSVRAKRLLKTKSNWLKLGPRKAFRGTSPNCPGPGIANAAGLIRLRSLFRYGLTPGMKLGRRMFREAPPPGVLITPTNPIGSAPLGKLATNPCGTVVATPLTVTGQVACAHCITTSGLTIPTSIGRPLRALTIPPISQSPSNAFPTLPNS